MANRKWDPVALFNLANPATNASYCIGTRDGKDSSVLLNCTNMITATKTRLLELMQDMRNTNPENVSASDLEELAKQALCSAHLSQAIILAHKWEEVLPIDKTQRQLRRMRGFCSNMLSAFGVPGEEAQTITSLIESDGNKALDRLRTYQNATRKKEADEAEIVEKATEDNISKLRNIFGRKIRELSEVEKQRDAAILALNEDNERLEEQIKSSNSKCAELDEELSEKISRLDLLEVEKASLTKKQEKSESEYTQLRSQLDSTTNKLQEKQRGYEDVDAELKITVEQLASSKKNEQDLRTQVERLRRDYSRLEGSQKVIADQLEKTQELNLTLHKELQDAKCDNTQLGADMATKLAQVGRVNGELFEQLDRIREHQKKESESLPKKEASQSASPRRGTRSKLRHLKDTLLAPKLENSTHLVNKVGT